jgi:predicted HTH transcriptional regulator
MKKDLRPDPPGLFPPKFEVDGFFSIGFSRPHETVSETVSETVNETIKIILGYMMKYPRIKVKVLQSATGFSRAKITRYIALMKKDDILRYVGSFKNGHYEITEKGRTVLQGKQNS